MSDKKVKIPKLFRDEIYDKNKEEFLYLDTLLNRKIIENTSIFLLGGTAALLIGSLLKICNAFKGKFVLTSLSGGIACSIINYKKENYLYQQYYSKWWDSLNNDDILKSDNSEFLNKNN